MTSDFAFVFEGSSMEFIYGGGDSVEGGVRSWNNSLNSDVGHRPFEGDIVGVYHGGRDADVGGHS